MLKKSFKTYIAEADEEKNKLKDAIAKKLAKLDPDELEKLLAELQKKAESGKLSDEEKLTIEVIAQISKSSEEPEQKDAAKEADPKKPEAAPAAEPPPAPGAPAAPPVGPDGKPKVTTQVADPNTGAIPPEPPEAEDFTLMPYADKVQAFITYLKELGFATVDYKVEDGKNRMLVKGKISSEEEKNLKEMAEEMELTFAIETISLENGITKTKIILNPKLNYKKFKDVMKIMKRRDNQKKADSMAM